MLTNNRKKLQNVDEAANGVKTVQSNEVDLNSQNLNKTNCNTGISKVSITWKVINCYANDYIVF